MAAQNYGVALKSAPPVARAALFDGYPRVRRSGAPGRETRSLGGILTPGPRAEHLGAAR